MHVPDRLLSRGVAVVGLDDLNSDYNVWLKEASFRRLLALPRFEFVRCDRAEHSPMERLMRLTYAPMSSVGRSSARMPYSVDHGVDHALSPCAAAEKSLQLMARIASHLRRREFDSSRTVSRRNVQALRSSSSRARCSKNGRLSYSTTGRCASTSRSSTTSARRLFGSTIERRCRIRPGPALVSIQSRVAHCIGNRTAVATSLVELVRLVRLIEEYASKRATLNLLPPSRSTGQGRDLRACRRIDGRCVLPYGDTD